MNLAALRHLVERAAAVHGETFDAWFPVSFQWTDLCADAPVMADRLGRQGAGDAADRRLAALAEAVFRAAYLSGLSVLAARAEGDEDPDTLLLRLARPLDEDEEAIFDSLAADDLAPIESVLGGEDPGDLSEDAEEAIGLVDLAWPPTSDLVGEATEGAVEPGSPEASVLAGIARVAAILAVFRWLAAARANEGWPEVLRDDGGPEE